MLVTDLESLSTYPLVNRLLMFSVFICLCFIYKATSALASSLASPLICLPKRCPWLISWGYEADQWA